ncbi:formyltetrahydrofolate deformylase [Benzoatithermus flavus]|uniref:Formyltetrahydrofolate deformylase n=1 Tax=Benzoatithermus flavus TaxID=3108223 RepID=A0ABU8XSQ8_9PROT
MNPAEAYVLTVTCKSERGQVAEISGFLAQHGYYINELAQFDDEDSNRFFARCLFRPDGAPTFGLEALREAFAAGPATRFPMEWAIHDAHRRMRVLIMVSKFDHCLNDLLYRHRTGELRMDVTAVVSNHPDLEPLVRWHGLPYVHLPITPATKAEQEAKLWALIEETRSELVVLARYMQVLSDELCERLRGRAINIHHSFLPGFKGAKPYHRAYERGVKLIGATAHYVTADLDEGPIIEQVVERVDHTLKPEDLVAVGRDSENLALARAVRLHLEHRVFINGNRTVVFR